MAGFFLEGEAAVSETGDYTSHNTQRLDLDATKDILLKLDFIKKEVNPINSN